MGDKASDTYFEGALIPAIDQRGDNPVVIRLSDEERDSGTTRPETIQQCQRRAALDTRVATTRVLRQRTHDARY